LAELKKGMQKFPQHMINVPLLAEIDVQQLKPVQIAVHEVERELGDDGRVLLRSSGTEPLVRVMIEGRDADQVNLLTEQLATAVSKALDQV